MKTSQTMAVDRGIAESLSPIEFDAERKSFKATYDSTRDPTSLAVIAIVAAALDREPQHLATLQSVVDTDALDRLATGPSADLGSGVNISFRYEGFEITVTGEDTIEANPVEGA